MYFLLTNIVFHHIMLLENEHKQERAQNLIKNENCHLKNVKYFHGKFPSH